MDIPGHYLTALHEWTAFVHMFGKLFGVHDEQLFAQASLDKVLQLRDESFGDFLVRFEDAALKTQYNDPAMRWKLLQQIRCDLRNRLTLVGSIPPTFNEVIERLLDLDGAREAFNEAGLSVIYNPTTTDNTKINRYEKVVTSATMNQGNQNDKNKQRSVRPYRNNNDSAQANAAQTPQKRPFIRLMREEYRRRMDNHLCIRCGELGHFGKECPPENDPIEEAIARAGIIIEEDHEEEKEVLYGIDEDGGMHQISCMHESEEAMELGNEEGTQGGETEGN
ncbi:hypothetical protein K435DRAFT_863693 [Dendrothele bispora CBS 962.96]|uniref:CCHC-type domain-containing protein n=1 Tax=Dendrothele bispora (strain CBS 962.96) TaxID=1314807 RepID=A0A4S8LP08_DENBC|nr:hypothetical protein K435DRAFT_863693 [Dendrothele bispora CBS 962.96]